MAETETSYEGDELPSGTAHYRKIGKGMRVFLLVYAALLDVIDIILKFAALDDFWILDALWFPVTQIYFRIKGVNGTYNVVMSGAELIPYVGALPLRVVGCWMVIYADKHPEKAAVITKVATLTGSASSFKSAPPVRSSIAASADSRTFSYAPSSGSSRSISNTTSRTNSSVAPPPTTQTTPLNTDSDILKKDASVGFEPFRATPYVGFSYEDDEAHTNDHTIDLSKKAPPRT